MRNLKEIIQLKARTLNGSIQYLSEISKTDEEIPTDNLRTHGEIIKNIGYDLINEADSLEKNTTLQ